MIRFGLGGFFGLLVMIRGVGYVILFSRFWRCRFLRKVWGRLGKVVIVALIGNFRGV